MTVSFSLCQICTRHSSADFQKLSSVYFTPLLKHGRCSPCPLNGATSPHKSVPPTPKHSAGQSGLPFSNHPFPLHCPCFGWFLCSQCSCYLCISKFQFQF